jgi:hypothetical protein
MNKILGYRCSIDIITGLKKCAALHRERLLLVKEANG